MKTALVVGATGIVGKELVAQLCEDERYQQVTIWVRRKPAFNHPKLIVQEVDFERLAEQTMPKVDEVFCALGTTIKKAGNQENFLKVDVQYPTEIAKLAKSAGVSRFVLISALGANSNARVFYSRAKGIVEENLRQLHFDSLQIVRPSLIVGERSDFRLGETIFEWLFKLLPKTLFWRYRPMHDKDIVRVMIEQAQRPEQGEYIYSPQQIQK